MKVYSGDSDLLGDLTRFVTEGLSRDDVVVLLATGDHRDGLEEALHLVGADVDTARLAGRYHSLDAAEMLASFMADGSPDPVAFEERVGGLIRRLGASGGVVRAFGEMVAILWEGGDVAAAIEVEALWNALSAKLDFLLYCGYPLSSFASIGDLNTTTQVCRQHGLVIPPDSYAWRGSDAGGALEDWQFFVPVPSAVRAVRKYVSEVLSAWGCCGEAVDDVSLVASELATNAVVHANTSFRVSLEPLASSVRISVEDVSPRQPERRSEWSDDSPDGRGMYLIRQLSKEWGTDVTCSGKVVWAEIGTESLPQPVDLAALPL